MAWDRHAIAQTQLVSTDISLLPEGLDAPQRTRGHAVLLQDHGIADAIKRVAPQSNERILRWSHFRERREKRRVVVASSKMRGPLLDLVGALPAAFAERRII